MQYTNTCWYTGSQKYFILNLSAPEIIGDSKWWIIPRIIITLLNYEREFCVCILYPSSSLPFSSGTFPWGFWKEQYLISRVTFSKVLFCCFLHSWLNSSAITPSHFLWQPALWICNYIKCLQILQLQIHCNLEISHLKKALPFLQEHCSIDVK